MANTINTRIVLRNDELSAWEASDKKLLKGEVAFAKLSGSNEFEMRVGDGNSTWAELSDSNVVVPDSTKFYEVTLTSQVALADKVNALSDYNATAKNGDIGVVKELIADGKYSHTAYRWDKASNGWVALDGNYNACNVIFDQDLTYTAAIGVLTKPSGSATLSAKGKTLEQVLGSILAKPESGSRTNPSISISPSTATVEYGTSVTPSYTFSFNDGAYTYGPEPTGATINSTWKVKTNGNELTGINSTANSINNNTAAGYACNPSTFVATCTGLTGSAYQISASVGHTAGVTPKNNLGEDDTSSNAKPIAANSNLSASRYLYTVYKPRYVKFTSAAEDLADFPASLDAADLSSAPALTGTTITLAKADTWYKMTDASWPTKINITGGKYFNVYFVAPDGQKSSWSAKKSDNVNVLNTPATKSVGFTYLNDDTGTYDLFSITNAVQFADTFCNITWS